MQLLWYDDIDDGQANADYDAVLGNEVAKGIRPATIRIWRSAQRLGIGVSKKDIATVAGTRAKDELETRGFDVVVRQTGGTAVPQGPGVIHLSYLFPRSASGTTDDYYRLLCNPFIEWLKNHGVQARTGELPGSYCDGTYNVLIEEQKLIGTAQAWRGGLAGMKSNQPGYILAHACVMVDVDFNWATRTINQFYELAESDYRVDVTTCTDLLHSLFPSRFDGAHAMIPWVIEEWKTFLPTHFKGQGVNLSLL